MLAVFTMRPPPDFFINGRNEYTTVYMPRTLTFKTFSTLVGSNHSTGPTSPEIPALLTRPQRPEGKKNVTGTQAVKCPNIFQ